MIEWGARVEQAATIASAAIIGPHTRIGTYVRVGSGAQIGMGAVIHDRACVDAGACVQPLAEIGIAAHIGAGAHIGWRAVIRDHVHVPPGAMISARDDVRSWPLTVCMAVALRLTITDDRVTVTPHRYVARTDWADAGAALLQSYTHVSNRGNTSPTKLAGIIGQIMEFTERMG